MSSQHALMNFNNGRGLGFTARMLHIAVSLSKALDNSPIPVLANLSAIGRMAKWVEYVHPPFLDTDIKNRFQSGQAQTN